MRTLELVVARYQEDLAWLRRVPRSVRVTVYDKGGGTPGARTLPNLGRESHTYLHHLVERYDSLADWTVFCQGRPFDHVPDFHRRLRALATGMEPEAGFCWWGFAIDCDDREGSRVFQPWSKNPEGHPLPMARFWASLWQEPCPEIFPFFPGAHFAVSRAQAQSRPSAFYAQARELSLEGPEIGHCFERCWDRVFGVNGIPEPWRGAPLPLYLRPVRRLGITWDHVPPSARPFG